MQSELQILLALILHAHYNVVGLLLHRALSVSSESFKDHCAPTAVIAADINAHREEDADVNKDEQKHSDGNEEGDAGRGHFAPEPDPEPKHGTR